MLHKYTVILKRPSDLDDWLRSQLLWWYSPGQGRLCRGPVTWQFCMECVCGLHGGPLCVGLLLHSPAHSPLPGPPPLPPEGWVCQGPAHQAPPSRGCTRSHHPSSTLPTITTLQSSRKTDMWMMKVYMVLHGVQVTISAWWIHSQIPNMLWRPEPSLTWSDPHVRPCSIDCSSNTMLLITVK